MAERKPGPVKPPVIDLTAREASASPAAGTPVPENRDAAKPAATEALRPAEKPADRPAEKPGAKAAPKPTDKPAAAAPTAATPRTSRPASPWVAATAGGIGGAIIAVAICYGLAASGYWPSGGPTPDPALAERLDQSDKSIADLDARLEALQKDAAGRLDSVATSLQAAEDNIGKLQSASGPDLAPLQDQLKTLSSRLDAVAAGASSADAGALAANVAALQQNSTATEQKFTNIDGQVRDLAGAVATLKSELDAAKDAIDQAAAAPSKAAIASALQLPLLISALEADFAAGRPFEADLAALTKALPETHVPASISDSASAGLPAPAELAQAFEARMPDMIGALPASTDSSVTGQLGDWMRNIFALRSQTPEVGDSPQARLSQLEAAVGRHDFTGAVTLLDQLPDRVKAVAGDVAEQLHAAADAEAFVAGLRRTAIAPSGGATQ